MGNQSGKEKKPDLLNYEGKKETDIKVKPFSELAKIDTSSGFSLPKAQIIKSKTQLQIEADEEVRKNLHEFSLKTQFDLDTYNGRFRCQLSRNNPLLFFTSNATIAESRELIYKHRMREEVAEGLGQKVFLKQEQITELKKADRIVGGAVHPDTNEIIPFYMRLSGFVAFNTPLVLLCLFTRNQTPLFNTGMQWVNQTYNAGMNYGNRNASSTLSVNDLAKGYCGAVAVSCSVAMVSRTMLANQISALKGPKLIIANAALNYFAAAFAGAANLVMMRQKELKDGINVKDEKG